jgi:drug/metabolite transporter (DMT)-like permease
MRRDSLAQCDIRSTRPPFEERRRAMATRDWGLILLLSVLWGGSFFFNAVALAGFGPLTLVLGRVALGAAVLLAVVYAGGGRMPTAGREWGRFLVMGALNNALPFTLIVWGQVRIDSGLAAILNATTPLFAVALAHVATADERLTRNRVAGVSLGFAGVVVLVGPDALAGLADADSALLVLAEVAVLAAAVCYAAASIYGRRLSAMPSPVAAAGMLCGSTLVMTPAALALERPWQLAPPLEAWGAIAGIGILSTAAAYLIYFRVLASAGSTNLMLVTFLVPASALLLGAGVLDEALTWPALAGLGLILAGLAAVDGRALPAALRLSGGVRQAVGKAPGDPAVQVVDGAVQHRREHAAGKRR